MGQKHRHSAIQHRTLTREMLCKFSQLLWVFWGGSLQSVTNRSFAYG
ncbi:Uncharacterised protein [Vibrio cholerae]|nr:Uncharacterised protein [Vibrio cholerae]